MSTRHIQQVKAFHRTYGLPISESPNIIPADRFNLRLSLIEEELAEFVYAAINNDIVEVADALGDLLYVVIGAALEYGIPLDEVVDEIHASNMSKLGVDGKPIYRSDGKVLKGINYKEPDIKGVLGKGGGAQ